MKIFFKDSITAVQNLGDRPAPSPPSQQPCADICIKSAGWLMTSGCNFRCAVVVGHAWVADVLNLAIPITNSDEHYRDFSPVKSAPICSNNKLHELVQQLLCIFLPNSQAYKTSGRLQKKNRRCLSLNAFGARALLKIFIRSPSPQCT